MANPKSKNREHKMPRGFKNRKPQRNSNNSSNFNNSSATMDKAIELSKGFHGRDVNEIIDIVEREKYHSKGAILGILIELELLTDEGTTVLPINFEGSNINVVGSVDRNNIYFIGGDQSINLEDVEEYSESELRKQYLSLGPVYSITYFTDKWHLEGPKYQQKGTPYQHEFGEEEDGELPELVYDIWNKKMMLAGGSYSIEDEGIKN